MFRIALCLATFAAGAAMAETAVPTVPADQAILACQARSAHALISGGDAESLEPVARFAAERSDNFMFKIKGSYNARIDGAETRVNVQCNVSETGVQVYTMLDDATS